MNFYSYFMDTSKVQHYPFGQAKIWTNGNPGQFALCGNLANGGPFNYVVYVNGARHTGWLSGNGYCTQVFDAGVGGDFQASIRRAQIFVVPSSAGLTDENYALYGFSQY
jgi:hypothetical protein